MTIALADLHFGNPEVAGIRQRKLNDLTGHVQTVAAIVADGDKGDIVLSVGGTVWEIDAGVIVNADVNAAAAIALTKLAATTASRALVSNGSGFVSAATTTATEIGFVNGVTSAIQTQIDGKQPLDADLTTIAGLTATTDNFIVSVSSAWASRTPAQVRVTLGVPSALFDHYATVGNGTTDETVLYSDTIAAAQLGANGAKLAVEYGGNFVSSATATRQVRIYFAETVIFDTGLLTLSLSSAWTAYVSIIRVSASVVRYMISFTTEGAALSAYTAVGELTGLTLANTAALKITGQAAGVGAATNDILAKLGTVSYIPAA